DTARGDPAPPDRDVTRRAEPIPVVSFPLDEPRLSVPTHKPVGRRHDDTADGRDPDERDGRGRGVAPQGRALRHELRGYKEESGGQVEREAHNSSPRSVSDTVARPASRSQVSPRARNAAH